MTHTHTPQSGQTDFSRLMSVHDVYTQRGIETPYLRHYEYFGHSEHPAPNDMGDGRKFYAGY